MKAGLPEEATQLNPGIGKSDKETNRWPIFLFENSNEGFN
ncbi:hypothetical protein A33Q_2140 [Indibacter alkaliphilus LW1]|uniref:Uncharacterized protein n=1 Tax=Indibacter alkaliphilus (strain CCUG 57479 / KCTC 22604 / LW1) TaxID=1189612 RepID=S2DI10_INDAL|nr:hypothetical protein A33Q_2140 [Indibacter alkaliphilus LW1]